MKGLLDGDGHPREARVCRQCWSCRVVYIGDGKERCTMCGHEQNEPYKRATSEEFNGGDRRK